MNAVPGDFGPRLRAAVVLGAIVPLFAVAALGPLLDVLEPWVPGARDGLRAALAGLGWLRAPLWGAAIGALVVLPRARSAAQRALVVLLALGLGAVPLAFPRPAHIGAEPLPTSARAKARAIRRWSYRSPAEAARIVALSRDPDPVVREQAALALGVNRVVDAIEHPSVTRPADTTHASIRAAMRDALLESIHDPVEAVRVEAARALWNAPVAFGLHLAAAETLASALDRAAARPHPGRIAWLALDAAAGMPHAALRRAAARFAATTSDSELARATRAAIRPEPAPR